LSYSGSSSAPFPSDEMISQVHVPNLEELDLSHLDPSLCVGFYFKTKEEFDSFTVQCRKDNAAKLKAGKTPIVYVEYAAPSYISACDESDGVLHEQSLSYDELDHVDSARKISHDAAEANSRIASPRNSRNMEVENVEEKDEDDEYVLI
jgi:hypothetical protein